MSSSPVLMRSVRAISVACMFTLTATALGQIRWESNPQDAFTRAQREQKSICLYFYSVQARGCQEMLATTFADSSVVQELNSNFVCLPVNVALDTYFQNTHGVFRVPCILFLHPDGREFMRLITYYPANKLLEVLHQVTGSSHGTGPSLLTGSGRVTDSSPGAGDATAQKFTYPGSLLYIPFDSLRGWQNEASSDNTTARITLLRGVRGNAFRIDYGLRNDSWNYIQVDRLLPAEKRVALPSQFTLAFSLAGTGGPCKLDIKLADSDGTNYGATIAVPTDLKAHRIVLTSNDIKYLWGGKDKVLQSVDVVLLGITPVHELLRRPNYKPQGTVFIDELVIVPGIHALVPANPPQAKPSGQ